MTWIADLEPCGYLGRGYATNLIAVGWLEQVYPYPRGRLSDALCGPSGGRVNRGGRQLRRRRQKPTRRRVMMPLSWSNGIIGACDVRS